MFKSYLANTDNSPTILHLPSMCFRNDFLQVFYLGYYKWYDCRRIYKPVYGNLYAYADYPARIQDSYDRIERALR